MQGEPRQHRTGLELISPERPLLGAPADHRAHARCHPDVVFSEVLARRAEGEGQMSTGAEEPFEALRRAPELAFRGGWRQVRQSEVAIGVVTQRNILDLGELGALSDGGQANGLAVPEFLELGAQILFFDVQISSQESIQPIALARRFSGCEEIPAKPGAALDLFGADEEKPAHRWVKRGSLRDEGSGLRVTVVERKKHL
jgi:hypothetical protein